MKTLIKTLLVLLISLTTSCQSDDDMGGGDPISQLPEATQTGAGTFGCLVNGEPFVDTSGNFNAFYQQVDGEFFFFVGGDDNVNGVSEIEIYANQIQLIENETYPLVADEAGSASGFIFYNNSAGTFATTDSNNNGQLTITRLDLEENIASGTFSFKVLNPDTNEIVSITDGRFDTFITQ